MTVQPRPHLQAPDRPAAHIRGNPLMSAQPRLTTARQRTDHAHTFMPLTGRQRMFEETR